MSELTPQGSSPQADPEASTEASIDAEAHAHAMLAAASQEIRAVLDACLAERPLTWQQGVLLSDAVGPDLQALTAVANALRRRQAGDVVTYVVNRNVNFTNVCVKHCRFCAFSRDLRSEHGYFLETDEVLARAREAHALGATEVCLQAGLAPTMDGRLYIDLCRAIKAALPSLHVHGFSPEEIKYGALRARVSIREYLQALVEAGLGSMPGTSAEILDDGVRARISPGRISTAQWIEVVTTAHALGLPTTSTMMYGHVESAADRMRHLALLRSIQADTGGFTEFVPLSFVPTHTPMYALARVPGVRPGPGTDEVVRVHAIARLMLGASLRNIQVSWVKEGMDMATRLLACGGNDLGGTLINESISTAAGAAHGQRQTPRDLRRAIRMAGREPAQRDTRYAILRRFPAGAGPAADAADPLDRVSDGDERFGSYHALVQDPRFRYRGVGSSGTEP